MEGDRLIDLIEVARVGRLSSPIGQTFGDCQDGSGGLGAGIAEGRFVSDVADHATGRFQRLGPGLAAPRKEALDAGQGPPHPRLAGSGIVGSEFEEAVEFADRVEIIPIGQGVAGPLKCVVGRSAGDDSPEAVAEESENRQRSQEAQHQGRRQDALFPGGLFGPDDDPRDAAIPRRLWPIVLGTVSTGSFHGSGRPRAGSGFG